MDDNDKRNKQTKIFAIIGGVSSLCTIFNVTNSVIHNPAQWAWAPICIFALISFLGWGLAIYYWIKNRKKDNSRPKHNEIETEEPLSIKHKTDYIREWFDDYVNSGEGHEYLKNLGSKFEQESKIKQMHQSLEALKEKNDSGYLESQLYYLYIFALLHGASKRVWAVSLGDEWIDTPEEKEFLRMNFEVAKKKIEFERFFVVTKDQIPRLLEAAPVKAQIDYRNTFFKTYIVLKEDLDAVSPDLYRSLGQGFLAFDDFAVADDRFQYDIARGYIFTGQDICKDFSLKFSNLRDYAKPLDKNFVSEYENMKK